jgi:nucleoside-diphosphate-sugar epimerase
MEMAKSLGNIYRVRGTKREMIGDETGMEILPLNFTPRPEGSDLREILQTDLLFFNVPPPRSKGEKGYLEMLDHLLAVLPDTPVTGLIFVSSTGVFGQTGGEVDELTEPEVTTERSLLLKNAEDRILQFDGCKTAVLRAAGLVGGDRNPGRFLAGKENMSGRLHPVNLVHRTDVIRLAAAIFESKWDHRIYHAVADLHPTREAFYRSAAERLGLPVPEFDPTDESSGKTVDGRLSKEWLNVRFEYDDPFEMI